MEYPRLDRNSNGLKGIRVELDLHFMRLQEVISEKDKSSFHRLPFNLYKNDPNWIPPVNQEIEAIFNPLKNTFFADGEAIRLLLSDGEKIIGRIAAFYNRSNLNGIVKNGGIGFFECINNQEASNLLFDAAKKWLIEKGCNAMDGPVNFGERDKWWGLLVEGFDPPVYGLNYHLPWYKNLFEQYGFRNYFEQYTFLLHQNDPMPEIVFKIRDRLIQRNHIVFKTAEKNNLKKYALDFMAIYNQAWEHHEGVKMMTEAQADQLLEEVKPIMDPDLFIFAYVKNEPVGFFIGIPDANQILKYADGNLNVWGKLNVAAHMPFVKFKNLFGIIFGVVPAHHNKGIEAGLAATMHEKVSNHRSYQQIEMLWIGDFNKKMLNFVRHIQAKKYRTLITYRIIFDEQIPFERCPVIE